MAFANPLPPWALALAVTAAALLAWYAYRGFTGSHTRRGILIALRLFTFLLLIAFLMRPVARSVEADTTSAIVPILVDTSRSMGIEDAGSGGLRRIDHARHLLERDILPALAGGFQVELLQYDFGSQAKQDRQFRFSIELANIGSVGNFMGGPEERR